MICPGCGSDVSLVEICPVCSRCLVYATALRDAANEALLAISRHLAGIGDDEALLDAGAALGEALGLAPQRCDTHEAC